MVMNLEGKIKTAIDKVLKDFGVPGGEFKVEHPENEAHGDYSANVALVAGGGRDLAEKITEKLRADKGLEEIASKIKVAGAGFINISIKTDHLITQAVELLKEGYMGGKSTRRQGFVGQRIMVEFTDPNPFKEFHIGHLYSNIVGESLCRLLEVEGAEVKRVNYQGDVGLHVAKAIWGIKQMIQKDIDLNSLSKKSLPERQKFMGQAYAMGATAYEEDKKAKEEIEVLNKKIYELDDDVRELYEKGRGWSLEYFETIYKRLGTKFDDYFFEREVGQVGLKLVKEFLKKGVFEESQGAVVFPGEKYGLHTRVFVNKLGLPTYEAKDLGLAPTKYGRYQYDQSIIVTANEIDEYFKVVIAALKKINPKLGAKTRHVSHGMVKLPEGKMSSRTGKIVTGEWLLDEAKTRALAIMAEGELSENEKDKIAEQVGQAAVKYALLKTGIGQDVVFNFGTSVSFEGNSGPYLQYTYARAQSVLAKSETRSTKHEKISDFGFRISDLAPEELAVLRWLYRYGEVVDEAAAELSPNLVANFLFELAQRFNSFYNKMPILKAKDEKIKSLRLLLTAATAEVVKRGLYLLGIQSPE